MVSLLGWGIGETITEILTAVLALIPKTMYFMYACLASALDALQNLMRRLAGLDGYYVGGNGLYGSSQEVAGDPVMEFIKGILGIGERAHEYSALNTTFWSLAIFGLIVLAVGTMIAIIKAHYQEDSAKTSPMSYLYNAFKAILTFAIVPFAVIIGIQLSTFLLTTLDNITAGSATTEAVQGIYGSNHVGGQDETDRTKLKANKDGGFSNYDFFGIGSPANTTTFSGMLFKTAAYEANRARLGSITLNTDTKKLVDGNGNEFLNNIIFGDTSSAGMQSAVSGYKTDENGNPIDAEAAYNSYLAYQFDYAFANNLKLGGIWHVAQVSPNLGTSALGNMDPYGLLAGFSSFSKYNVGLVWVFYDLWHFNFIIGFAAVFTIFGMFISIIIGLMSRLIKSVALFLIYPATLGLASLDDFGAFKKWRQEFMKNILSAFGSIIGMNIFFLIFPYLGNITFYPNTIGYALLNNMVNTVILITGLLVIKSFIEFVSGLVGGGNALSDGDGLKSEVGKTMMTGVKKTVGAAAIANKIMPHQAIWQGVGTKKGLKQGIANYVAKRDLKKADALRTAGNAYNENLTTEKLVDEDIKNGGDLREKYNEWYKHYLSTGRSKTEADKAARQEVYDEFSDGEYKKNKQKIADAKSDYVRKGRKDDNKTFDNLLKNFEGASGEEIEKGVEALTERATKIRSVNYMDKDGNKTKETAKHQYADFGKDAAGAFFKNFMETLGDMKINVGKLKGLFYQGSNKTVDEKGSVTGETWQLKPFNPNKREVAADTPKSTLGSLFTQFVGGNRSTEKKESVDKVQEKAAKDTAKAAEDSKSAAQQTSKEIAEMRKDFKELANTLSAFVKKGP